MAKAKIKNIQIDPDLHRRITFLAWLESLTIRDWSERALQRAVDAKEPVAGNGVGRIVTAYQAGHITAQEGMEAIAASPAVLGPLSKELA